jgi:hypothetical protein
MRDPLNDSDRWLLLSGLRTGLRGDSIAQGLAILRMQQSDALSVGLPTRRNHPPAPSTPESERPSPHAASSQRRRAGI